MNVLTTVPEEELAILDDGTVEGGDIPEDKKKRQAKFRNSQTKTFYCWE